MSGQGPTRGFEKWVGRRTDFRILNNAESRMYAAGGKRDPADMPKGWKPVRENCPLANNSTIVISRQHPNDTAHYMEGIRMQALLRKKTNVRLTMLDKFMFDYAKRALEEFRKCFSVRRGKDPRTTGLFHSPSSGIIITLGAIHLCDKVSVYGVAEDVHVNAPYQYFMNMNKRNFGHYNDRAHNFELEKRWMRLLATEGLIRKCERGACTGKGEEAAETRALGGGKQRPPPPEMSVER
mmetsp:Transcript_7930/g.20397  ORF Transcript_7930/g.20397 Transcript_7930/m.20397 type:complete len:238 (-) Transcript_7930:292-1005(-)